MCAQRGRAGQGSAAGPSRHHGTDESGGGAARSGCEGRGRRARYPRCGDLDLQPGALRHERKHALGLRRLRRRRSGGLRRRQGARKGRRGQSRRRDRGLRVGQGLRRGARRDRGLRPGIGKRRMDGPRQLPDEADRVLEQTAAPGRARRRHRRSRRVRSMRVPYATRSDGRLLAVHRSRALHGRRQFAAGLEHRHTEAVSRRGAMLRPTAVGRAGVPIQRGRPPGGHVRRRCAGQAATAENGQPRGPRYRQRCRPVAPAPVPAGPACRLRSPNRSGASRTPARPASPSRN